jgi:hypothetical protein
VADRENFRRNNTFSEWRIEVTAKPCRTDQVFLHVLHCADRDADRPIPCELLAAGPTGQQGVRLTLHGKTIEVCFTTAGPARGSIKIGDGQPLPLPESVEDNYRRWKDDPRYRDWMTEPGVRAVIGEVESR